MGNPTDKNAEESIGGIDPNAFDMQMLLMDAFLGNLPGININRGNSVADPNDNVPYLPNGVSSINALIGTDPVTEASNINNFISSMTPHDYAQMYPKIDLFYRPRSLKIHFSENICCLQNQKKKQR